MQNLGVDYTGIVSASWLSLIINFPLQTLPSSPRLDWSGAKK